VILQLLVSSHLPSDDKRQEKAGTTHSPLFQSTQTPSSVFTPLQTLPNLHHDQAWKAITAQEATAADHCTHPGLRVAAPSPKLEHEHLTPRPRLKDLKSAFLA
jgi:hypothetical protein